MIKIPDNNRIVISNSSDSTGNIFQTKNLNFDKLGKIKLSPRTSVIADSGTESNLKTTTTRFLLRPVFVDNGMYIAANKNVYYSVVSSNGDYPDFTQDAATGTPTLDTNDNNDMLNWDGELYVCNGSNIYNYSGAPGVNSWSTFSTENATIMEVFTNLNQLACAIGTTNNSVKLLNSSGIVVQTLNIPDGYGVVAMAYNNERLYVSAKCADGEKYSLILEWDGLTPSANNGYVVEQATALSLCSYKEGVAGLLSNGKLIYVRGGVQELDKFPIYDLDQNWFDAVGLNFSNSVSRHSLSTDGNKIYIAINSSIDRYRGRQNNTPYIHGDFKSGVWCYDPNIGLYHRFSVGQSVTLRTDAIATTSVNTSTDVITVAGATVPPTGTPCFYKNSYDDSNTSITGLVSGQKYYVINQSSTTLKLATTRANAEAGTAIDLTGTGNNSQYITFHPEYDFGGTGAFTTGFGFIQASYINNQPDFISNNEFICGFSTFDASTSRVTTLSTTQKDLENRGYLITSKFKSASIMDIYNSIVIKHEKLVNEDDDVILKYRVADTSLKNYITFNTPNAVWTDENTFTSTDDLSEVVAGDEVEIIDGAGAGYLAHVSSIAEAGGTYTVNIDEDIRNLTASDIAKVIFQNWKKISPTQSTRDYKFYRINQPGKWIQLKIELRGIGTTIEEIIINNTEQKPVI